MQRHDLFDAVKRRDPVVSNKLVKQREREFDPVLGRFRDPSREQSVAARERAELVAASNKGRDKQLKVAQTYNIITHKALVDDDEPSAPKPISQTYRSRIGYNIISNKSLSDHHYDAPGLRPDPESPASPKANKPTHVSMARDYDIVSGKYLSDHEAKAATDHKQEQADAADRWWQTRDFDPILQRYYDADKDSREAEATKAQADAEGQRRDAALPDGIRYRDSAGYDTLQHRVTDEATMRRVDARLHRPLVKHTRRAIEARLTEEGVSAASQADARSLQRAALKQAKDLPDKRPYNVITGAALRGVDAMEARRGETAAAMQSVARLEAEAGRHGRAGAGTARGASGRLMSAGVGAVSARSGHGSLGPGPSATVSGFGTIGGVALPTGATSTQRGFMPAVEDGRHITAATAARAVGAQPHAAVMRDASEDSMPLRAARKARRVRVPGEAWQAARARGQGRAAAPGDATESGVPVSTRVRRR
jgi:hypothetical protein